jgi:hypothetical protein
MAEQLPEAAVPRTMNEPVGPTRELARKNVALALALLGIAVLIAAGAIVVALVYLHYD